MTTGTVKSQGTKLYFAVAGTSSEIHAVACPTQISGLGGAANQIDITCLDSAEMEYVRGMQNPGQITVPINLIPRSASHQALLDLRTSGDETSFGIFGPDSDPPTDVDSNGNLVGTAADQKPNIIFRGYVADFTIDVGTNDIWRGSITIQRTGAPQYNFPTADLA
jgi:hypothetical protein